MGYENNVFLNVFLDNKPRTATEAEALSLADGVKPIAVVSANLAPRFKLNMNVLDSDGVPRVMSIKEVLREFLNHRHTVLIRRTNYRLEKINYRLEILSG